jgi:superfamily II DNA or RNA helicase
VFYVSVLDKQPASDYAAFLQSKRLTVPTCGFRVDPASVNPLLFAWQRELVIQQAERGRGALFADCGLGKGPMQLEWARQVNEYTAGDVLILAPLAVAQQTVREGVKFGIPVNLCRRQSDLRPGLNVTNYELLPHFDPQAFSGLVADESSILKGSGPVRKEVCAFARTIPYRLACTATPAPNDVDELINHAEFLGIMERKEIIGLWFTQEGGSSHTFRLKGHAKEDFWRWVASWATALRKPSDLGYPDDGYELPPITYREHTVVAPLPSDALFQAEARGIQEQRRVRRDTLTERVAVAAALANADTEPWLIWCELNAESDVLGKAIPDAAVITGSDSPEVKEERLLGFVSGKYRVLVSKPEIAGFGMNLQHCARLAFVGLGNSQERYYQAIRRCYRFGQTRPVEVHVIVSEADGPVVRNIARKEQQAAELLDQLVREMSTRARGAAAIREEMAYAPSLPMRLPEWLCTA